MNIRHTEICECICHKDEMAVMHFKPCCQLTYRKYIDANGEVDMIRWGQHHREANKLR